MSRNFAEQINKTLSPEVRELIRKVSRIAKLRGQKLYLVGGIVRDLMLDKTSSDLDFSLESDALSLARSVGDKMRQRVVTYAQFGTATIKFNDIQLDIATARTETYSHPGALPEVKPASIVEDLYRRDFTINAMALDLSPSGFGNLIDPLNGVEDLRKGLIKVIHERSFRDDATRIFRAIRYEQRLNFVIEKQTLEWALRDKSFISTLSGERIRHEIDLILREEYPEKPLQRGEELHIWEILDSALHGNGTIKTAFEKLRGIEHKTPCSMSLLFCLLFFPLSKEATEELIKKLAISKSISVVLRDVMKLKKIKPELESASKDRLAFYQLLKGFSPLSILTLAIFYQEKDLQEALFYYYNELRLIKPSLKGRDLLKMGLASGPSIGEIIQKLHEARLLGHIKSRREEVEFVKKYPGGL